MKKPYFAHFLENQMSEEEANSINAGGKGGTKGGNGKTRKTEDTITTLKYPSDDDEDGTVS
ncbi:MAG: hypothetical protein COC01_01250 [Bacteroidetes bacterium]|nr:MAG: hypothetical protein COC01_01250 [Bacteroidota bacterium]